MLKPRIRVSGERIRHLMRVHKVTVDEICRTYDLPKTRVREVRKDGGPWDWPTMILALSKTRSKSH